MDRLNRLVPAPAVICLVLLVLALSTPSYAYLYDTFAAGPGYPNRVDDHIDSLFVSNPTALVDITVDFCSTPTSADSAYLAQFGTVYDVFRFVDAISVEGVVVSDCYTIVTYPRVKLVEWERPLKPNLDVSCYAIQARSSATYPYPSQAVWDLNPTVGYTGSGVNVAIIDSGVDDSHPALSGKFVAGYDVFTGLGGPGVNPDDDMTGWFHGTFVAGIIMGNDPAQQYMGVAPGAGLVDVKIFNASGSSPPRQTTRAIRWVMQNAPLYNIQVANLSIGGFPHDGTDLVSRAADALAACGVVVVASAGNYPPSSGISAPGAGNDVIAVGGVTDNGTVNRPDDAYDSNARVGPRATQPPSYVVGFNDLKPEVSAYMRDITSCLGVHPGQAASGFWQHTGNGTSWATAHVSGVVALLLEKFPGITPAQVDNLLRTNAEPRGTATYPTVDPVWNYMYGWGIVSAADAVNATMPVDVSVKPWVPGSWNSKSIWAGHYPVKVGDPNSLNARVYSNGGFAPGVQVDFEVMMTGWGSPWSPIGSATVNVPSGGSAVATLPYTPVPGSEGHRCFRVTATYASDPNPANNSAQENIDVEPAQKRALLVEGRRGAVSRQAQRFAFPVRICVEPTAPFWRTADACICTKDLPPGASAWLEPEPPFDLMPAECQPCSLIVEYPEGVPVEPGDAVYVNGWFWGNGVAEGGVAVHFVTAPPIEASVAEIQYTDDPSGASPMEGQSVAVSGVATAGTGTYPGRFAIQDGEGSWNGLFVTDVGLAVDRGDLVETEGMVIELDGVTQLDPFGLIETTPGGSLPDPATVAPGLVDTSEAYEGVLVALDDVTVVDDTAHDWIVESDGTCHVGRWSGYSYVPVMNDYLDVRGVMGEDLVSRKLQPRDDDDIEPATGVPPHGLPTSLALSQNRPNPFGAGTGISYALPADGYVELRIYDVSGRLVRTLVEGLQPAGKWTVAWDGRDDRDNRVASGVYFYSLRADGKTVEKRMVLID
ncbi:MAG: S8 family serine peptidase [Candidatus Eisenbacteria bacterium]|nr:S8 family serine peptidase [Candidatus Eisenbacteria bacterium]